MGHHAQQHGESVRQMATARAALMRAGLCDAAASWKTLAGGRTNRVWRISSTDGSGLICKLVLPGRDTPLFPNRPGVEYAALRALRGSGLAPDPVAHLPSEADTCVVYRDCPGETWRDGTAAVGRLLGRLHRHPPQIGLRWLARSPGALLAQGEAMIAQADPALARLLQTRRPSGVSAMPGPAVFLHGDPVPGNIVMAPGAPVLIDWQCPAMGDPLHDLALFLSPAMQVLGRGAPLAKEERDEFLSAYDGGKAAARFSLWEPAFCWRMAAYCGWRLARGHHDYAPALDAELKHLEHLRQNKA